jgi:hypothetical protein
VLQNRCSYWLSRKPEPGGSMVNAKSIGWAIYAAGLVIWLFGYLSAGHAPVFDWKMGAPGWMSSFVPNFEAELGLALMLHDPDLWARGTEARASFWLCRFTTLLAFPFHPQKCPIRAVCSDPVSEPQ